MSKGDLRVVLSCISSIAHKRKVHMHQIGCITAHYHTSAILIRNEGGMRGNRGMRGNHIRLVHVNEIICVIRGGNR